MPIFIFIFKIFMTSGSDTTNKQFSMNWKLYIECRQAIQPDLPVRSNKTLTLMLVSDTSMYDLN